MSDNLELVADAMRLQLADSEKRRAYADYNYASTQIKVADVEVRRAVIFTTSFEHVEHGKLHAVFGDLSPRERDLMRAIARYVATGRIDK